MSEAQAESLPAEAETPVEQTEEVAPAATPEPDQNVTANGEKLDRQTRNWRALERDRDHWREMAMRQQPEPKRQEQRQEPEKSAPKSLSDFQYDEAAYTTYLRQESARLAQEAVRQELAKQREMEAQQSRQAKFAEKQTEFAKEAKDYHEVVSNPAFRQSDALLAEIMESDSGPELAYYLANNLDVTARLNQLPPVAVAREVVRIEAKLAAEKAKAKEAKNQIPATAPAPKIDGSGTGQGAPIDLGSEESNALSADEWLRRREKKVHSRK